MTNSEVRKKNSSYHICPICKRPIEAKRYQKHQKTHGKNKTRSKVDLTKLNRILDGANRAYEKKKGNALFLFFDIARKAFSEVENIDTSLWNYVFDHEYPKLVAQARMRVPSPHPPMMCHIKFEIKDKKVFDKLCEKYKGTEKEAMLKAMVSQNIPTIVVYGKNWANQVLQWKSEGMTSTDIEMLTVFFFLHEMYHIMGFGEKDATTKASVIMNEVFGQNIGIPEHEIERWKYEEKLRKGKKQK